MQGLASLRVEPTYDREPLKVGARLVPEVGLEPTLAEANTALNRARLPIPPLRQSRDQ